MFFSLTQILYPFIFWFLFTNHDYPLLKNKPPCLVIDLPPPQPPALGG